MSDIVRRILEAFVSDELALAKSLIQSTTLADAVRAEFNFEADEALLHVPHYWAVYYHDGRGPIQAAPGHKLVFFHRPEDDPRLEGGYPERVSQVRRLTADQFYEGLEINRERFANGLPPYMYVLNSVGAAKGDPFFDDLAVGAAERMDFIAQIEIEKALREDPDLRGESDTAYLSR